MRALFKLVRDYQENQFINHNRDISFLLARQELLGGARVGFYEHGSTEPKNVYQDSENDIISVNPVVADSNGVFPKFYTCGVYSLPPAGLRVRSGLPRERDLHAGSGYRARGAGAGVVSQEYEW